jgi:hypothetical protein
LSAVPAPSPISNTDFRVPVNIHEQFFDYIRKEVDFSTLDNAEKKLAKGIRLFAAWRLALLKDKYVKQYGSKVQSGPLKGLDFTLEQTDGCLIPKLMGCYEKNLHPFFEQAMSKGYDTVVDIGCAEGYYAVGMAMKMPEAEVFAHDISEKAREACSALAKRNGVENRVHVGGIFSGEDFEPLKAGRTLVVCDIEGAEKELLDPVRYPNLKNLDLIVEVHDCYSPGLSSVLAERFAGSHNISLVQDYSNGYSLDWAPSWYWSLSNFDQMLMLWEMREGATPWLVMHAKNG